jgi:ABC-type transporter Mla MlaB component
MRKLNDRKSRGNRWRQPRIQHWRFQLSGVIYAFSFLIFLFWGTFASAQIDSIQQDRAKFRQAEILFQSGQINDATATFKTLTKSINTSEAAHFRLSTIYSSAKNYSQAIYHINRAVEFCKTCDDYLLQKAQILQANFQYKEAADVYVDAINLNPNFWSRYPKAINAYKLGNRPEKAIEVIRLWEKQFQLKPEIGLQYISEFTDLNQIDSALLYSKKLLLKYPKNIEILSKSVQLYQYNRKDLELSELFRARYLLDTSNIDFQIDFISNEILPQMQVICDSFKNEMSSQKECKSFSQRTYYKRNQSLIRKISLYKNLNAEQKSLSNLIFFGSETNVSLIDSCLNINFPNKTYQKSDDDYNSSLLTIAYNLYTNQRFKEAQKYCLMQFYGDRNLSQKTIELTLHCIALNSDKLELEKCKNYLEEILPFMVNTELFGALDGLSNKQYSQVIQTIELMPNISKNANKNLLYNLLAYSKFMTGEIKQATDIWSNLNTEDILEPYLISAFQSFQTQGLTEKAKKTLNMAYFLGIIDEEGKNLQLKNTILPKK